MYASSPYPILCSKIRQYLIDFLIGPVVLQGHGQERYRRRFELIGYTSDPEEMKQYPIVIIPSGFFDRRIYGTEAAYPQLPLTEWRGIPLLFGEPREEWHPETGQLILYADLLASAFFLVSRYEEMYCRKQRDDYGRFLGKYSLPYRAGFLQRPIVDEYGATLRQLALDYGLVERYGLQLEERPQTFSHINLTHDLARPYNYRGWRSFLRAWLREGKSLRQALRLVLSPDAEDDYYTYPKFLEWDKALRDQLDKGQVDLYFFIRMPSRHALDKPCYRPRSPYIRRILLEGKRHGVRLGLQSSFAAGKHAERIREERRLFEHYFKQRPQGVRHNRLMSCEPEDLLQAYFSGFRNDFTMGYPDVAGFRLGTCRPVRFINPNTRLLTDLVMHPLILRDLTLSDARYMALDQAAATELAEQLVRTTARYNGSLTLLWHNDLLSQRTHPWHSVLYRAILRLVAELHRAQQAPELASIDY